MTTEQQGGAVHREAWLDCWELTRIGVGMDDATVRKLRREDEEAFPVEDVGVFATVNVVWAVKS